MKTNRIVAFTAIAAMVLSLFCTPCYAQNVCEVDCIDDEMVFIDSFSQPEYPGGMKAFTEYIKLNKRYPDECVKNRIEGR